MYLLFLHLRRMLLRYLFIFGFCKLVTYSLTNISFHDFIGESSTILMIGDSLTYGQILHKRKGKETKTVHAYSKLLQTKWVSDSIKNKLIPVTQDFALIPQLYFNTQIQMQSATQIVYKAAIIFAGHDDILNDNSAMGDTPNTIVHNIVHLHEYFHSYVSNGKVTDRVSFVVTLPEFKPPADEKKEAARLEVNKLLRSFASRCKQRVTLIEASTLFGDNIKYFSDDNYLSSEGYDAIANLVYETLKTTTVPKMTSSERQAYIDKCFANAFPLFKGLRNGTILAIGDSLTYGESFTISSDGKRIKTHNPYTNALNNLLNVARTDGDAIVAVEKGKGGEDTNSMFIRLDKELDEFVLKSKNSGGKVQPLKAVAILGGTIDLLKRRSVPEIISDIVAMHELVLNYKIPEYPGTGRLFSFALTIPPIDMVHGPKDVNRDRIKVNDGIRKFAAKCSDRVILVDLENIYDQADAAEDHNWSPDLLHFSAKGYSGVANSVHYSLLRFLDHKVLHSKKLSDEEFFSKCFLHDDTARI